MTTPILPSAVAWIFAGIYLAVDIAYVFASRGYYGGVAARISGTAGFPEFTPARALAAALSYGSIVIAWLAFVPLATRAWAATLGSPITSAMLAGFLLAFTIYGVFNGTLYVMFAGHDASVVRRDMTWGLTWMTLLSGAYGVTVYVREGRNSITI